MQKKNEKKKKYLLNIWSGAKAVIKSNNSCDTLI